MYLYAKMVYDECHIMLMRFALNKKKMVGITAIFLSWPWWLVDVKIYEGKIEFTTADSLNKIIGWFPTTFVFYQRLL